MASYIDHVCYWVSDLDWEVRFFQEVYGMTIERTRNENGLKQVWMVGGLQFREDKNFQGGDIRNDHVCLLVDDLEGCRAKALEWGCSEMPQHHWVKLPDGLKIEMFSAKPGALDAMKAIDRKL